MRGILGAQEDDPGADVADRDVERYRAHLLSVAYRMLGDAHDAEDAVQEAFLRWHRMPAIGRAAIATPEGWLVRVVTRLAIDRRRRAGTERRAHAGGLSLAPGATTSATHASPMAATDHAVEMVSELSSALTVLLQRLAPDERAALLLRDVFDVSYEEIARRLGRTVTAVRQVVHRARVRVRMSRPCFGLQPGARPLLAVRFHAALARDDREAVLALVASDHDAVASAPSGVDPDARHEVAPWLMTGSAARCGRASA